MGSEDNPAEPAPGASPAPSRVGAYLYPWDLLGDPDVVPRLVEAGFEHVTVAAAYHGVRAATPQHPQHRFVVAETAALYRPVRDSTWGARRLRPFGAPWTGADDSFRAAVEALHAHGVGVSAWVVSDPQQRPRARTPRPCRDQLLPGRLRLRPLPGERRGPRVRRPAGRRSHTRAASRGCLAGGLRAVGRRARRPAREVRRGLYALGRADPLDMLLRRLPAGLEHPRPRHRSRRAVPAGGLRIRHGREKPRRLPGRRARTTIGQPAAGVPAHPHRQPPERGSRRDRRDQPVPRRQPARPAGPMGHRRVTGAHPDRGKAGARRARTGRSRVAELCGRHRDDSRAACRRVSPWRPTSTFWRPSSPTRPPSTQTDSCTPAPTSCSATTSGSRTGRSCPCSQPWPAAHG